MTIDSSVRSLNRGFKSQNDEQADMASFTVALCEDNSAFIRGVGVDETKYTLYPPPSAELIKKLVYSQRLDRYIILLSSSTMCFYKLHKDTALLEKLYEPGDVRDSEGKKALAQGVSCMTLI
jgi:hypothetical protein